MKLFLSLQSAALAVCLVASVSAFAQETSKIGFVNTDRIFKEATLAKTASAKIDQEFSPRNKEIEGLDARLKAVSEKLDKDGPMLSNSDRIKRQRDLTDLDKEFQRKQREFREDLNQRRNEELAALLDRSNKVIRQIAESEKYEIIFQEGVYVSPRIDITDKVIKALNNGK